jgi:CubicO group peptidase (beta-lactamase class C family)
MRAPNLPAFNRRHIVGSAVLGAMAFGGPLARLANAATLGRRSGLSPSRLARIDPLMTAAVERGETPGLVGLICRHGEVAHVVAAGWQDVEKRIPMRRDSIFQIMSMTKPITAAAVMILVDEGIVGLYDPVGRYLPELATMLVRRSPGAPLSDTVPAERPIRIVDLLNYRSGLASSQAPVSGDSLCAAIGNAYDVYMEDPAGWLGAIGRLPLATQPGTAWAYGTSSDVLAVLVGRVSGMPFAEFLARRIFEPLRMRDTAHFVPPSKRARFATAYHLDKATGRPAPGVSMPHLRPVFPDSPPAFAYGSYGLASTADDYLRFARMMLERGSVDGVRILSHRATGLMTSNYLTDEQRAKSGMPLFTGLGWGLGLAVVVDTAAEDETFGFGSKGTFLWPGAFGTWWQADPQEDMIEIYMHQYLTYDANVGPRMTLQRLGYEAIED